MGPAGKQRTGFATSAGGGQLACWLLAALVLLAWSARPLVQCQEQQITVESREPKQGGPSGENELSDTLKYLEKLEKLDQYWSEVARPRFGRSEYKQPSLGRRMLQQPQQRPQQPQLQRFRPAPYGSAERAASLAELLNGRLAQSYNSNELY